MVELQGYQHFDCQYPHKSTTKRPIFKESWRKSGMARYALEGIVEPPGLSEANRVSVPERMPMFLFEIVDG